MKSVTVFVAATAVLALAAQEVAAQSRGRVRADGPGVVAGGVGPNGGGYVRGRGAVQNADGSATAASGGAFKGPRGARGARASTTTLNPDGSAERRSAAAVQGPEGGAVQTTGSVVRNADGTYNGTRSTQATGPNGAGYSGTTSYDPVTGVTRSTTCTDRSGAVVACPR